MHTITFFLRLYSGFSIRHLRRHPGRAALVLLGVALGAAVFTSVRLSIHASLVSFTRSMEYMTGKTDRTVVMPGGRLPEELVATLLAQPQVRTASPVMSTYVQPAGTEAPPFLLIGLDPILDRPLRQWREADPKEPDAGKWATLIGTPFTLIAGRRLTRRHGWQAGKTFQLSHTGPFRPFRLAGILASQGLALAEGGNVAITDMATFQEFTGTLGRVDRIDLKFYPGEEDSGIGDIEKHLPEGAVMLPPTAAKESGRLMIRAYQLNLSILSFASLFVGMFLVYSLVALNAASRRKELAILRAVGASPRIIFGLFLVEGTLFGLLGWLVAIPIGGVLTRYMVYGIGQTISTLFVRVGTPELVLSTWEIFASFAVTVAVSLAAALQPAHEAMKVPPREVLATSMETGRATGDPTGKLAIAGILMIALVVPLSKLPGFSGVPVPGYVATILLFAGFSLLAPLGLRRTGRLVAPLLGKTMGISAYLAGRYVRDSGARTAVSVGALITAVALYTSLVIMIFSFRETVKLWVSQTVSGDYFVAAKLADINRFREPLSANLMEAFKHLDTPVDLVPSRRFQLQYGRVHYQFEGMAMEAFLNYGRFIWLQGSLASVRDRLFDGRGVLISEVFANRTGLSVGDVFRGSIRSVRTELPVLGVIRDYRTQGGVVFCDMSFLDRTFPGMRWTGVRFFLRDRTVDPDAAIERLKREIVRISGGNLEMVSGKSLREDVLRIFDETFAVTTVLLLIALLVAALGITTTLTVLILERTRQLNTLFALGAGYGQIRSMILWEASLMVAAGLVAGMACGFVLSYLLIFVINRQSFGWTFLYQVDWANLAWSIPLIAGTALCAALPAMRAVFRSPPATLLRER